MASWNKFWCWMKKSPSPFTSPVVDVHDHEPGNANPWLLSSSEEFDVTWNDEIQPVDPRVLSVPTGEIGWETGPLEMLQGRRVLAVVDCENLSISARDQSLRLSYSRLLFALRSVTASCEAHGFFSRMPGDDRLACALQRSGLITHPRDIEFVERRTETIKLANSDSRLLFMTGVLMSQSDADTLLIASGDGDLGCELARGIRALPRAWSVMTLSLAGSSSRRLDAATNPDIQANLEIGLDVLQPLPARRRDHCPTQRDEQNLRGLREGESTKTAREFPPTARANANSAVSPRPFRKAITRLAREPEPRLLPIRPQDELPLKRDVTDTHTREAARTDDRPPTLELSNCGSTSGPLNRFLKDTGRSVRQRRPPANHSRA